LGTLESSGVLWSSPEFPKFNYFLLMLLKLIIYTGIDTDKYFIFYAIVLV